VPFRSISAEPIDDVDLSAGNGGEYGSGGGIIGAGNAGVGGLSRCLLSTRRDAGNRHGYHKDRPKKFTEFRHGCALEASILRPASSLG
jgi:hypothetical protein